MKEVERQRKENNGKKMRLVLFVLSRRHLADRLRRLLSSATTVLRVLQYLFQGVSLSLASTTVGMVHGGVGIKLYLNLLLSSLS